MAECATGRKWVLSVFAMVSILAAAGCSAPASDWFRKAPPRAAPVSVIPMPANIVTANGAFLVDAGTAVTVKSADPAAQFAAQYFEALVKKTEGLSFDHPTRAGNTIDFRIVPGVTPAEGYVLDINPAGIAITASEPAGLFYGGITLWQLMSRRPGQVNAVRLAAMHIEDAPRFGWRGLMLDSARHFQSPDFVKHLIDAMAIHKLNVLQWHLTDDQGWRIEIKKYPRLTKIGAWRVPAGAASAKNIDPKTGKPRLYGGYYTQDQIREIVAYAAARHITIVPEIEMPGHALAAIVAYPHLGSVKHPPKAVSGDWGVFPYLYNVDGTTFTFLENVLTEVMALFPSPYIHVGGDEAVKDQWRASPKIQKQMRALGIKDENALQGYFTARIGKFLTAHHRRLIGWDEVLQGGVPADAAVMSWRGIDGAIAAAELGHDTVLSPAPTLYYDNMQSMLPGEPPGRGAVVSLKDVYAFDPVPAKLTANEARHVIGLQGNVWTEHIRTDDRVSYMTFPREAALAELAWSPASAHDWHSFLERLPAQFARYRALHIVHATSAFDVDVKARPAKSGATVTLSNQTGFGTIRYTLDGRDPSFQSAAYAKPLDLPLPASLKAAAFAGGHRVSRVASQLIDAKALTWRDSHHLKLCTRHIPLNLEDDAPLVGKRAVFLVDIMNPCWVYEKADLTGITTITATVGQVPFNYQVGEDAKKIPLYPPHGGFGALTVHLGDCGGPVIAALPLARAVGNDATTRLSGALVPQTGTHDLCLVFTRRKIDPIWVLGGVGLSSAGRH